MTERACRRSYLMQTESSLGWFVVWVRPDDGTWSCLACGVEVLCWDTLSLLACGCDLDEV